jgi:hypothetical protein
LSGKAKVVLCVARDSVSLCQVARQRGESYILSSQAIRIERKFEDQGDWLGDILEKFDAKFLKRVEDVIFSTTLGFSLPLKIFYSRDSNFNRVAIFELENLMGDRIDQFKFWIYGMDEDYQAYAFRIPKVEFTHFMKIFESVGIKNPRILLSPLMFFEGAKLRSTAFCTAFLNVDYDALSILFGEGEASHSCLLPIDLKKLARKISPSADHPMDGDELRAFIEKINENDDPKIQPLWDEFFDHLCSSIKEKVKKYFGETREVVFAVGGHCDERYGLTERLQKTEKVFPYHLFFRQQISPIIDSEIVSVLEIFIPPLLATAALDEKCLDRLANLQMDTSNAEGAKQTHFFYEKCIAGLICSASILFYFSQKLSFQCVQEDRRSRQLLAQQAEMSHIAERMDALDKRIGEQKRSLENVLVYVEQNRAWCRLLNALQEILSQMDNVYINSFTWTVQTAKKKKALATQKSKKIRKENENIIQSPKNQEISVLSSSIHVAGMVFIGNVGTGEKVRENFNDKFSALFDRIRCLPFCAKVSDIKINLPENDRITFRCVIGLDPQSKIVAP